MVLWGPVLGALLVAVVGFLCLRGLLRQRRPQEPPLDKGCVPWLGHAMAFRKNMLEFLKRMRAKHGDVFTVQLGGQYFTFLMDPLSFSPILRDVKRKLDFVEYAEKLVLKVFGYHSGPGDHRMIHSASTKHLMGDGLEDLNKTMGDCLSLVILGPTGQHPDARSWQEDGLFHFCYNALFKAGYLSLFGYTKDTEQDLLQAEELFVQFRKFDCLFPRFVYSLLGPREWLEVGRLQRLFHENLSVKHSLEKDGISNWIAYMLQFLREQGVAPAMQDKFNFMMLWASQGNTGPTSFWALLFLLKHPEAMQALREEAAQVLGEARLEAGQAFNLEVGALQRIPVLDSVMEETLRLRAAPTLLRVVNGDHTLQMASGEEYQLRGGDVVALFPYLSVHMDPDIHPQPSAFKYDRFLNPDGSRKVDFYKAGKKIHHYTMPWGSGVSMCPGRFLALSEMKLFILLMITHFDLELVDPNTPIPPVDPQRWGFGTTQPSHDVRFRYRLRSPKFPFPSHTRHSRFAAVGPQIFHAVQPNFFPAFPGGNVCKACCLLFLPTLVTAAPEAFLGLAVASPGLLLLRLPEHLLYHSASVMNPCSLSWLPPPAPSPLWGPEDLESYSFISDPPIPQMQIK